MNRYDELKKRQEEEINQIPIIVAFSYNELKEGMQKIGLTEKEKMVNIGNAVYLKEGDIEKYRSMIKRFDKELAEAINNKNTGIEFTKDMFFSQLKNNEYGYTRNLEYTLKAVGYTKEEIDKNGILKQGLELALEEYKKAEEEEKDCL